MCKFAHDRKTQINILSIIQVRPFLNKKNNTSMRWILG